jgi:L-rhamnose mutarotase
LAEHGTLMADRVRYGFRMKLRQGTGEEYARLHRAVDPVVIDEIRRAGIHNYSIFLDGTDLFGYLEIDDLERCRQVMSQSDPSRPWARLVTALFAEKRVDEAVGMPPRLIEVFRFDG